MLTSSNDITSEILGSIEEMAKHFFIPDEIALALEIATAFMQESMLDTESEVYRAFQKGWLQAELDQRRVVFQLASSGSSPAQTLVSKILDRAKSKMIN